MTEQHTPSKAELLEALRSSGAMLLERFRALPAEQFESGRYEGGWNGRQILAHIAAIEWTYPRLLDLAKDGPPPPVNKPAPSPGTDAGESNDKPARQMQGGVDGYNERLVAKRSDASVEDLLAEFEKNRAATIAAVEEADAQLFATPIRSAGGISGALADVINLVAVRHVLAHAGDILGEKLATDSN